MLCPWTRARATRRRNNAQACRRQAAQRFAGALRQAMIRAEHRAVAVGEDDPWQQARGRPEKAGQ
eukprot:7145297-Prymnesium_polylepis.1